MLGRIDLVYGSVNVDGKSYIYMTRIPGAAHLILWIFAPSPVSCPAIWQYQLAGSVALAPA